MKSINPFRRISNRILLSRAKHRSLHGHPRLAVRLSRLLPFYEYSDALFYASDSAPSDIQNKRQQGFERLARLLQERAPKTLAVSESLARTVSDLAFVSNHSVP